MAGYGWGKGTVVRTYEQSGIHVGAPASMSTIYMNIVDSVSRFGCLKIFRVQNRCDFLQLKKDPLLLSSFLNPHSCPILKQNPTVPFLRWKWPKRQSRKPCRSLMSMDRNKEFLGYKKFTPQLATFEGCTCRASHFFTQTYDTEVNGGDFDFLQTSYWDPERPHVLHWTTADLAKAEPSKWTRTCQFFLDKDSLWRFFRCGLESRWFFLLDIFDSEWWQVWTRQFTEWWKSLVG